nr:zf-HC2 domain-containing protein [Bryobacterales bacterium]
MPEPQAPFLAGERLVGGLRCSEVLHLLSDYLDGDLSPEMRTQVEAHVADCDNCARFGASFQRMLTNSLATAAATGDPTASGAPVEPGDPMASGDLAESLRRTQNALKQRLAAPPGL